MTNTRTTAKTAARNVRTGTTSAKPAKQTTAKQATAKQATAKQATAKQAAKGPAAKRAAVKATAKQAVKAPAAKKVAAKATAKQAAKAPAAKKVAAKATAKQAAKAPAARKVAAKTGANKVASVSPLRGSSVDDYAAKVSGWQADAVRAIAGLVQRVAPAATSAIKWAQPVFELDGPFAFVRAAAKHVTLGFWRGGELKDPKGALEGDGTRMKHIKLKSAALDEQLLGGFIREAVALNKAKGDPTKLRG
jgi:hypothetical protein